MTQKGEQLAVVVAAMESNKEEHKEIKEMIKQLSDDIKCLDTKFAPKWIEKFVYTLIVLIFSALLGGAISSLFK